MSIISYAQNHEDVILWRVLKHVRSGFYVDVGANDPVDDSVTKLFYDVGWHGINIEPTEEYFARLQKDRGRDINLSCAVGASDEMVTFYETTTRGWSTSNKKVGEQYHANGQATLKEVQQLCLNTILERHGNESIHFLKIDVEGAEAAVIAGLNLERFRPWVLVVESLDPITQRPEFEAWERKIVTCGYNVVFFDGLNRYFLAKEHEELTPAFGSPPNVLDNFLPSSLAHYIQRATDSEVKAQQAEAKAQQAEAKVDELNRSSHHWWTVAEGVNRELQSVYASKSWRITLPLRKTMLAAKWALVLPTRLMRYVFQQFSALVSFRNTILRRMLKSVLLIALAKHLTARFPALNSRLRAFAHSLRTRQVQSTTAASVQKSIQPLPIFESGHVEAISNVFHHALPKGQRMIYYYVDHTVGCPVNTGMQRVVRGLAQSFVESGERLCFVKWNFDHRQLVLINRDELAHLAHWHGPELTPEEVARYPVAGSPGVAISAHQMGEANWLVVPEVTYINNHPAAVTLDVIMAAKRLGLKSAFVFYDATPLRRKELTDIAPKHEEYMQQLLLADLVVPISEWSASDLAAFFTHYELATPNTIPKIVALPLTGESQLSPRETAVRQTTRQLILSVGSITPYKNQLALTQAFEAFILRHPESGWELTLVGNIHHDLFAELAVFTTRTPSIKVLNNAPDEELNRLLDECAFTVFPSVMEGCGLPILESLWHGKPCICANFGAMAEVATGGGCLMVDVRNSDTILSAIERLVFEPETLSRLQAEALARPLTSWRNYANDFSEALNQVSDPLNQIGVVYYWIDHTAQFPTNTGIQRVTRQLARSLMALGAKLVPVRWDQSHQCFAKASSDDLAYLSQWNGPSPDAWVDWQNPADAGENAWLIVPELIHYLGQEGMQQLQNYARTMGLKTAWIYYDALPITLANLYDPVSPAAHREYMLGLRYFDLILAISAYSTIELRGFLAATPEHIPNIDTKIQPCILPGEFLETPRITQSKDHKNDICRILCVGTAEPRKNHTKLLLAYDLARQRSGHEFNLTLVGRPCTQEINELILEYTKKYPNVRWEQNANDTRLRELYDQCDFTVFPSLAEGFGLPVLESLWHARPCICRNTGALGEVAIGGGCLVVDTADVDALADAMLRLVEDDTLRQRLATEATQRHFKTWREYGTEVAIQLANEKRTVHRQKMLPTTIESADMYRQFVNLSPQPLLSICISTYNRSAWLALSLKNLERLIPIAQDDIEIVVCDNTSTDNTPEVVKPYIGRSDFRYYRNPRNVGMLGNLQVTAHHARGRHVWILGDDDLVKPGSIKRVLQVLREQPDLALVYLNYAYTREDDATAVRDLDRFLAQSTPIIAPGKDIFGPVRRICTESENFFTAIYSLVFRRDHALQAYSQNTEGRPFSTMLTCIPTTYYVLHHMMDEPACWIGEPQLVVNMNVSWLKYAPLWILERLPEVFDCAETLGADPSGVDRWRVHNLQSVEHFFREIFENDSCGNAEYFSPARLIARFKHLEAFKREVPNLMAIYEAAYLRGAKGADVPTAEIFAAFQKN